MTDGPFKNLKLARDWKRFAEAAHNDAVDIAQRCALAAHALLGEILTEDTQALLNDLLAYQRQPQLDMDPWSSVESIFDNHSKTAFSDTLRREMAFRLGDGMAPGAAIGEALEASVDDQIGKARNRIQEECIHARETGEIRQGQLERTITRANEAFDTMSGDDICDALRAGDHNAFKKPALKRKGLDEGPGL